MGDGAGETDEDYQGRGRGRVRQLDSGGDESWRRCDPAEKDRGMQGYCGDACQVAQRCVLAWLEQWRQQHSARRQCWPVSMMTCACEAHTYSSAHVCPLCNSEQCANIQFK